MCSVSIALLQAIDQRLFALVHMTKTAYLDCSAAELERKYAEVEQYDITPLSTSLPFFQRKFRYNAGRLFFNGDACVLAVPDDDHWYREYQCVSDSEHVQAFREICRRSGLDYVHRQHGVNFVNVSEDGAIILDGCWLYFS